MQNRICGRVSCRRITCAPRLSLALRCTVFVAALLFYGVLAGCTPAIRYSSSSATTAPAKRKPPPPALKEYAKLHAPPADRIAATAQRYLGIPYRYGGMSRSGTDCSGLVVMIFTELNHKQLPRSTAQQRTLGRKISLREARSGDLLFFRQGVFGRVGHVGIYISDNTFIHASTRRGVIMSSLDDEHYRQRFVEIRRILK
jgi:probable lipoprotein NlpC